MGISVLLADDHQYTIDGFALHLHKIKMVGSVTTVKNGADLLEYNAKENYDLIITDIDMPEVDGIQATQQLKRNNPEQKIIVVTGYVQMDYIKPILRSEPDSILEKGNVEQYIEAAIEAVFLDKKYYSPTIKKIMNNILLGRKTEDRLIPQLTSRQKEILHLLAKGKSNTVIGEELHLSPHAISSHRTVLFNKFGVNNIVELVLKAQKYGLI